MARACGRRARRDLGLAAGVVLAGLAVVLGALFTVRVNGPAELLLRVHGAGLLGLWAACWGVALADDARARLLALRAQEVLVAQRRFAEAFAAILSLE
jgi:hypothetical protein